MAFSYGATKLQHTYREVDIIPLTQCGCLFQKPNYALKCLHGFVNSYYLWLFLYQIYSNGY